MSQERKWWHDPIVEEIHTIRRKRAERLGHDPQAMFDELKRAQQASGAEIVRFAPRKSKAARDAT